jgi:hypothetical protein
MPLTPQQVGERTADAINEMARQSGLRLADVAGVFERAVGAWPGHIMLGFDEATRFRRMLRRPRQQLGGSSVRAVKRRRMRRWRPRRRLAPARRYTVLTE